MSDTTVILWLRQDLRTSDNPALIAAARAGQVLPVYILDDDNAGSWSMGAASRWWLHESLQALNNELDGNLWTLHGDPQQLLPQLAREQGATAIYWNRCYEPWRVKRDGQLKDRLKEQGLAVHSYNGSLLWEPWQVRKEDDTPYRVFTPFYNKGCRRAPEPRQPERKPARLELVTCAQPANRIESLSLLPDVRWYESLARCWRPGQEGARRKLARFLDNGLADYREGRDFPARDTVSRLSPHLHFGELSPNQVWYRVQQEAMEQGRESQGEHLQRELGWREFSYSLLYHFPDLPTKNFQDKFDRFPWRDDPTALEKWCRGQTGYPIVDAGMRELWQTGYMHNRVRMIVASFLVKNLLIHWHRGEQWFWDCLVDADLANNSASWQWVAGSGADAAPYFRIFNPVTQGRKFDPDGDYVRRFIPEIAGLADRYLHDPSSAPARELSDADIELGDTYPRTMVDLGESRKIALDSFKGLS